MKFTKQGITLPKLRFTTENFSFLMKELHPRKWGVAGWLFVVLFLFVLPGFLMVDDYSEATTIHTYSFVVFGHSFATFDDSGKFDYLKVTDWQFKCQNFVVFVLLGLICFVFPIFVIWATFYNERSV